MKYLFIWLLLLFGCSSRGEHFTLELREQGIANLDAATPYKVEAVENAIRGVKALKLQKVTPRRCSSIIVVQRGDDDIFYIHPDAQEKKIAYIEVVDGRIFSPDKLHIGISFKEAQTKNSLDCNATKRDLRCKHSHQSAITYHFSNRNNQLDKIVLTF